MATLDELEARLQSDLDAEDRARAGAQVTDMARQDAAEAPSKLDELEAKLSGELAADPGAQQDSGSLTEGFNGALANLLGFPAEVVNEALGYAGANFAEGGDSIRAVHDAFNKLGIRTTPKARGVMDRIGQEAFNAVLSTIGLRVGAPRIQAATATSQNAGARVANQIATDIIARPKTAIAAAVTSAPGVVIGQEAGGQAGENIGEAIAGGPGITSKVGRVVGETVGSIGGGGFTSAIGTGVAQRVPGLARSERPQLATPGSAILDQSADPNATRVFARDQIHRELTAIDRGIENAVRQARGGTASLDDISTRLSRELDHVYEQSRLLERRAWGAVPGRTTVTDVSPIERRANNQLMSTDADPSRVPDQARRFLEANQRIADGERAPWTVGELLEMRSGLLTEARNARSGTRQGGQNLTLANNLEDLADDTLTAITRALPPGDPRVQRARELSLELNNRFTRGPISSVLSTTRAGEARIHPADAVATLMRDRAGPQAVATTREPLNTSFAQLRVPGGQQAMNTMDDAIRASYADEVQRSIDDQALRGAHADPFQERVGSKVARAAAQTSQRWMQKHEGKINAYARASTQVRDANQAIIGWANDRDRITSSAFAGIAQRGAELVARDIINGKPADISRTIQQIKNSFRIMSPNGRRVIGHDDAAEEGFKKAMLNEVFGDVRSATRAKLLMEDPSRARALKETLTADEFARLNRIMSAAAQLETKDPRKLRGAATFAATGLGRIIGLWLGRVVAHTLTPNNAAGSLSLPARFGSNMSRLAGSAFDEEAPMNLLARAVTNPKFEKLLLERIPSNLSEAKAYTKRVRAAMVGLEAARQNITALPELDERMRKD